jgi:hypothetical protein
VVDPRIGPLPVPIKLGLDPIKGPNARLAQQANSRPAVGYVAILYVCQDLAGAYKPLPSPRQRPSLNQGLLRLAESTNCCLNGLKQLCTDAYYYPQPTC